MEVAVVNTNPFVDNDIKEVLKKFTRMIQGRLESKKVDESKAEKYELLKNAIHELHTFTHYWNLEKFDVYEIEGRKGEKVYGLVAWFEGLSDPWFFSSIEIKEFFKDSPYENLVKNKIPFLKKVPRVITESLHAMPLGNFNNIADFPLEECDGYQRFLNQEDGFFNETLRKFNEGLQDPREWEQGAILRDIDENYIKRRYGQEYFEKEIEPYKSNFPQWRKNLF